MAALPRSSPRWRRGQVFTDKITVCVRKRPISKREVDKGDSCCYGGTPSIRIDLAGLGEMDCITMPDGELTVVHEAKEKVTLSQQGQCVRHSQPYCKRAGGSDQVH